MKKFFAGVIVGFLIASCIGLLCFRYQISASSTNSIPIVYRLDRLTGQTSYSFGVPGRDAWRSIPDTQLDLQPERSAWDPAGFALSVLGLVAIVCGVGWVAMRDLKRHEASKAATSPAP